MRFERAVDWDTVFTDWCLRETGEDWGWERVWREHGFSNWPDWRRTYVERFGLEGRAWNVYEIENPLEFVPNMYVGAYKGWKKYYPDATLRARFRDLVGTETNEKVMAIFDHMPQETTIIGVKHGDDFVVFEGTHRAAAIARIVREGKPFSSRIHLVLTELRPGEKLLFEKGTTQIAS